MVSEQKTPGFLKELDAEVRADGGSRIRLECRVSGRPKPSVAWTKDGNSIQVSSRVRIIEAYTSHTLLISRAEAGDSGVYQVTATNVHGQETSSARVEIKGSSVGTPPPLTSSSMTSSMSSRKSDSSSSAAKRIGSLSSATGAGASAPGGGLNKTAASRLVSGNIWARNSSTVASGITPGSAGGAPPRRRGPGFILRPKPKTVRVGESLTLKCTLLGHPKPTVTWEKDGELVDEERTDGHIRTAIDGNNYFLEIEQCRAGDGGRYAVTARNSLGKQMAGVDVTVSDGPAAASKPVSPPPQKSDPAPSKLIGDTKREIKKMNGSSAASLKSKIHVTTTSTVRPKDDGAAPASPTGSVSSSLSVQSRQSSVSSRSNHSAHGVATATEAEPPAAAMPHQQQHETRVKKSLVLAPTITRRLSSTQVLEGEELLLQCVISGEPEPELQWFRNGVEFNENQVFVSFRNGVARLRLRDVQLRHAGEFTCVARNDGGEVRCSSRVTVKARPVNKCPRFVRRPADVRACEGESLKLEAEVEGSPAPEILWSIDGQEIQDADCSFANNVARLVIKSVTVGHTGQYMCNAINAGGEDSVACRVRIKERKLNIRPEFTAPLSDVRVAKDETMGLRCMVTAIPEPTVHWYCNNHMIDDLEGVEVTFQDGVAGLSLEKCQPDDSGVYSCVAVNCEGEGRTSCNVTVQDDSTASEEDEEEEEEEVAEECKEEPQEREDAKPPMAPKFTERFDEFIRSEEGDEVVLRCSFHASPPPVVTWSAPGGKPIEGATCVTTPTEASLVIAAVSSAHHGPIKCLVSNEVGKCQHETRLSVRTKRTAPTLEKPLPDSLHIEEGESGEIHCVVHGHPQPRITWSRDGRSLSILSTETTYESGTATVKIRRATARDSGKYVCTARNLSGDVESSCRVTVAPRKPKEDPKPKSQPPHFVTDLEDQSLDDGQDLRLACEVRGMPEPRINWQVDGADLAIEDTETSYRDGVASLFLEDVMQEDSGRYSCVAVNEAGRSETSCNVKVAAPAREAAPGPASVEREASESEAVATNGGAGDEGNPRREPSFVVQLKDETVREGDDIRLKCKIIGNPVPEVTWLLDGEEIVDAELRSDGEGGHELILVESLPDDEGVYTCIATNPLKRVMTSCKITIETLENGKAEEEEAKPAESEAAEEEEDDEEEAETPNGEARAPEFLEPLADATVADGSRDFRLACRVAGFPAPEAEWYFGGELIVGGEEFAMRNEGETRSLVFSEVFPEDTGAYTCVIRNRHGEQRSSANLIVEEIDGEAPNFHTKPRPVTSSIGEKAVFSCQVDGDPAPSVSWMFNGQELPEDERVRVVDGCAENNYTSSLEIDEVAAADAGRYSVTCSNLLGNITCTVSLIVNDAKRQETRTDFRDVLKQRKSPTPAVFDEQQQQQEQVDFRGVLRKASTQERGAASESDDAAATSPGAMYKEALSTQVKTKALSEEERKKQKAEQVDFRSATLVRKVDTKVTQQDEMKIRGPEQQDFRDEALRTHVRTKHMSQDELKKMQAEQVDFRAEAIKTKVVTKAYKEENVKTRKVEQVDFRTVLSPTRKSDSDSSSGHAAAAAAPQPVSISDIPRGKWKRDESLSNNTVATKRSRNRATGNDKQQQRPASGRRNPAEDSAEVEAKPEFKQQLRDIEVSDGAPFELTCHVTGNPRPEVKWYIDDDEIGPDDEDFVIGCKDGRCTLSMSESLPDDEGLYTCRATNAHGAAQTSAQVTYVETKEQQQQGSEEVAGAAAASENDGETDDGEAATATERNSDRRRQAIATAPIILQRAADGAIEMAGKAPAVKAISITARATAKSTRTVVDHVQSSPPKRATSDSRLVSSATKTCERKAFSINKDAPKPQAAASTSTTTVQIAIGKSTSVVAPKPKLGTANEVATKKPATVPPTTRSTEAQSPVAVERPDKPTVHLSARERSVKVTWKAKKSPRGGAMTEYTIEECQERHESQSRSRLWMKAATTIHTSYTLTNIRPGVVYRYRIIAKNRNATSEASAESDPCSLPFKQTPTLRKTSAHQRSPFSAKKQPVEGGGVEEKKTPPSRAPTPSVSKRATAKDDSTKSTLEGDAKHDENALKRSSANRNSKKEPSELVNMFVRAEPQGDTARAIADSAPSPQRKTFSAVKTTSGSARSSSVTKSNGIRRADHVSKAKDQASDSAVVTNGNGAKPDATSDPMELFKMPQLPPELASLRLSTSQQSVESGESTVDEEEEDEERSNFVRHPRVEIKRDEKFQQFYEIHERLGQGRFGKVHRVTCRRSGVEYAAKIMRSLKAKDQSAVSTEIEMMNQLRHPRLVQLVDAYMLGREITMVMECVGGGELFERVVDDDFELTEQICVEYIRQICEGVEFMHENNIIHLDLKPENILCVNKTGTKIKIIDFGLARRFDPNENTKVLLGTPEFVAPEVVNFDSIGLATDMWSIGVICYILLSGLSPFAGDCDSETYSNITAVRWDFEDEAFDQISEEAKDFICHLLVKNMSQRFSIQRALRHAWLAREARPSRRNSKNSKRLNTKNLRKFIVRRKWQKTGNAVRALNRLQALAKLGGAGSGPTSNGSGKSGFVTALRVQMNRESEKSKSEVTTKPRFVSGMRSVECPSGTSASFECSLRAHPRAEITWTKDGKQITSDRFRTTYREERCVLRISRVTRHDVGAYVCRASNTEGSDEISARLTVKSWR